MGDDTSFTMGLTEHWDGHGWTVVSSPATNIKLNAVTALSLTNAWAAGVGPSIYFPRTLIEQWNGTTWGVVASPDPTTRGNSFLEGIAAVSANDIWTVGGATTVGPIIENWDGTNWTILATPSGIGGLNGVTARSDGIVVAVGVGTNNSAVILHN